MRNADLRRAAEMKSELQFQASQRKAHGPGFPAAVQQSLEIFQAKSRDNMRRGLATVHATVATPEEGAYFVIVFAGPFENLETLQAALAGLSKPAVADELLKIGL